jgi:uncharacterized protein (TIGR02646 family)
MIRLPHLALPRKTSAGLRVLQKTVNALPTYADRVAEAKRLFELRNRTTNPIFREVRKRLAQMCGELIRCCYCEDSCADQVEHHRPKNHFPDYAFVWKNFLHSCGRCNIWKQDQFAVFEKATGRRHDLSRSKGAAPSPRSENPLDLMDLDLLGTFWFNPISPIGSRDFERADYTIKVLRLNTRTELPTARRGAFDAYLGILARYHNLKNRNASQTILNRLVRNFSRLPHRTVWEEMKRQHNLHSELKPLFADLPEARKW